MKKINFLVVIIIFTVLFGLDTEGALSASLLETHPSIDLNQAYSFQINFTPKFPGANENIKAEIQSYSFDTDLSIMTWNLNGKIVAQGKGAESIEFKTGNIGSVVKLIVSVKTEKGQSLQKTLNISIGEIDLLWQAFSYTPGFYKGKALATMGSKIKLTVVTHGLGSSQNLIYEWRRNFQDVPKASGAGKNSYTFDFTDFYGQEVVRIRVWGPNKEFSVEKTIVIKPSEPEVLFYPEHPLEGTRYEKSFSGEIQMDGQPEMVIRAEPFFFPKQDIPLLSYKWTMNGGLLNSLEAPNVVGLLAPQDKKSGYSLIQLDLNNPGQLMQMKIKSLNINLQ